MPYPEKEENNKENQEKKVKKKKSSKIAEGQLKESVKESIEEKKKETEKKNEMDKKKEEEREKEKSDVETIKAKNLQDNVSVEKSMIFNAVSLPKEIKIRNEVGKSDLIKLSELKEAFQLFDFNCDGIIDLEDLKFTFITMGKPDVSEEQLQRMLSEIPTPIDFDAFITLFGQKVSEMDSEEVITAALSTWDMRNIGMIPENKIRDDLQKFGDKFTIKEVDRALEEAPIYLQDGNAMIDYIKFSNNICGFQNLAKARQYQKNLENP
ncbi:myosin regulatory light chain sqh-like isoform X1 [Vespa velutina]|uniref:myosin regulatory light chain sqh-like isoform X1 n=1 Tax=Vespa velutina TaxID=202808 RepID=UPI001FB4A1F3|nr:myosin regulatory light chain sqh-like isoform X1 [Vespa velutina]